MSDNIHVAIRVRPLIKREKVENSSEQWHVENRNTIYQIDSTGQPVPGTSYVFDCVFDKNEANSAIYTEVCRPIVESVMQGFNGTIFAYGQTSSGKTYTMMGDESSWGVIPSTIEDIFNEIENMPKREFLLRVSYMEIYNETISDLLCSSSNQNLKIQELLDGQIVVKDLKEEEINSPNQVLTLMKKGSKNRHTGETNMNERSSRSHAIFRMIIESRIRSNDVDEAINVSHLNLVDLGGSERATQTGATGDRFKEGIHINLSLLTLGNVISRLSEGDHQYVNFRDSKLTRILQNSLGGNARTAIICTVTPAVVEQTHSTLKFASRAKCIKNKPTVNEVLTDAALLKRYARMIQQLTEELKHAEQKNCHKEVEAMERQLKEKDRHNLELENKIKELKKKFVVSHNASQVYNIQRKYRRETWAGPMPKISSLPLVTNGMKQPLKSVEEDNPLSTIHECSPRLSFSSLVPDSSICMADNITFTELPTDIIMNELNLAEQIKLQDLSPLHFSPVAKRQKKSYFSVFDVSQVNEIGTQTEHCEEKPHSFEIKLKNSLEQLREQIAALEASKAYMIEEGRELQEFIILENQIINEEKICSEKQLLERIIKLEQEKEECDMKFSLAHKKWQQRDEELCLQLQEAYNDIKQMKYKENSTHDVILELEVKIKNLEEQVAYLQAKNNEILLNKNTTANEGNECLAYPKEACADMSQKTKLNELLNENALSERFITARTNITESEISSLEMNLTSVLEGNTGGILNIDFQSLPDNYFINIDQRLNLKKLESTNQNKLQEYKCFKKTADIVNEEMHKKLPFEISALCSSEHEDGMQNLKFKTHPDVKSVAVQASDNINLAKNGHECFISDHKYVESMPQEKQEERKCIQEDNAEMNDQVKSKRQLNKQWEYQNEAQYTEHDSSIKTLSMSVEISSDINNLTESDSNCNILEHRHLENQLQEIIDYINYMKENCGISEQLVNLKTLLSVHSKHQSETVSVAIQTSFDMNLLNNSDCSKPGHKHLESKLMERIEEIKCIEEKYADTSKELAELDEYSQNKNCPYSVSVAVQTSLNINNFNEHDPKCSMLDHQYFENKLLEKIEEIKCVQQKNNELNMELSKLKSQIFEYPEHQGETKCMENKDCFKTISVAVQATCDINLTTHDMECYIPDHKYLEVKLQEKTEENKSINQKNTDISEQLAKLKFKLINSFECPNETHCIENEDFTHNNFPKTVTMTVQSTCDKDDNSRNLKGETKLEGAATVCFNSTVSFNASTQNEFSLPLPKGNNETEGCQWINSYSCKTLTNINGVQTSDANLVNSDLVMHHHITDKYKGIDHQSTDSDEICIEDLSTVTEIETKDEYQALYMKYLDALHKIYKTKCEKISHLEKWQPKILDTFENSEINDIIRAYEGLHNSKYALKKFEIALKVALTHVGSLNKYNYVNLKSATELMNEFKNTIFVINLSKEFILKEFENLSLVVNKWIEKNSILEQISKIFVPYKLDLETHTGIGRKQAVDEQKDQHSKNSNNKPFSIEDIAEILSCLKYPVYEVHKKEGSFTVKKCNEHSSEYNKNMSSHEIVSEINRLVQYVQQQSEEVAMMKKQLAHEKTLLANVTQDCENKMLTMKNKLLQEHIKEKKVLLQQHQFELKNLESELRQEMDSKLFDMQNKAEGEKNEKIAYELHIADLEKKLSNERKTLTDYQNQFDHDKRILQKQHILEIERLQQEMDSHLFDMQNKVEKEKNDQIAYELHIADLEEKLSNERKTLTDYQNQFEHDKRILQKQHTLEIEKLEKEHLIETENLMLKLKNDAEDNEKKVLTIQSFYNMEIENLKSHLVQKHQSEVSLLNDQFENEKMEAVQHIEKKYVSSIEKIEFEKCKEINCLKEKMEKCLEIRLSSVKEKMNANISALKEKVLSDIISEKEKEIENLRCTLEQEGRDKMLEITEVLKREQANEIEKLIREHSNSLKNLEAEMKKKYALEIAEIRKELKTYETLACSHIPSSFALKDSFHKVIELESKLPDVLNQAEDKNKKLSHFANNVTSENNKGQNTFGCQMEQKYENLKEEYRLSIDELQETKQAYQELEQYYERQKKYIMDTVARNEKQEEIIKMLQQEIQQYKDRCEKNVSQNICPLHELPSEAESTELVSLKKDLGMHKLQNSKLKNELFTEKQRVRSLEEVCESQKQKIVQLKNEIRRIEEQKLNTTIIQHISHEQRRIDENTLPYPLKDSLMPGGSGAVNMITINMLEAQLHEKDKEIRHLRKENKKLVNSDVKRNEKTECTSSKYHHQNRLSPYIMHDENSEVNAEINPIKNKIYSNKNMCKRNQTSPAFSKTAVNKMAETDASKSLEFLPPSRAGILKSTENCKQQ